MDTQYLNGSLKKGVILNEGRSLVKILNYQNIRIFSDEGNISLYNILNSSSNFLKIISSGYLQNLLVYKVGQNMKCKELKIGTSTVVILDSSRRK